MKLTIYFIHNNAGTIHLGSIEHEVFPGDTTNASLADLESTVAELGGTPAPAFLSALLDGRHVSTPAPARREPSSFNPPPDPGDAPSCPVHRSPMYESRYQSKRPGYVQYYCPQMHDDGTYCRRIAYVSPEGDIEYSMRQPSRR